MIKLCQQVCKQYITTFWILGAGGGGGNLYPTKKSQEALNKREKLEMTTRLHRQPVHYYHRCTRTESPWSECPHVCKFISHTNHKITIQDYSVNVLVGFWPKNRLTHTLFVLKINLFFTLRPSILSWQRILYMTTAIYITFIALFLSF